MRRCVSAVLPLMPVPFLLAGCATDAIRREAAGAVQARSREAVFLIGTITFFIIALRWFETQEESGGHADILAIGVSVISFELYAAALGGFGYLPGGQAQTSQFLAIITIMWVALVPFALRRARR